MKIVRSLRRRSTAQKNGETKGGSSNTGMNHRKNRRFSARTHLLIGSAELIVILEGVGGQRWYDRLEDFQASVKRSFGEGAKLTGFRKAKDPATGQITPVLFLVELADEGTVAEGEWLVQQYEPNVAAYCCLLRKELVKYSYFLKYLERMPREKKHLKKDRVFQVNYVERGRPYGQPHGTIH